MEIYCTYDSFVGLDIITLSISIWARFTISWMIARMTGNKMTKRSTMTSSVTNIDVIMTQRRLYKGTRICWTCRSLFELLRSPAAVPSLTPGTPVAVAVINPAGCIACSKWYVNGAHQGDILVCIPLSSAPDEKLRWLSWLALSNSLLCPAGFAFISYRETVGSREDSEEERECLGNIYRSF